LNPVDGGSQTFRQIKGQRAKDATEGVGQKIKMTKNEGSVVACPLEIKRDDRAAQNFERNHLTDQARRVTRELRENEKQVHGAQLGSNIF